MTRTAAPNHQLEDHRRALFAYAYSRLRDKDIAQEVVQETLLAAWRGRHRFAGESTERTWLVGILKRRLGDHWRNARRHARATESLDSFSDPDALDESRRSARQWNGASSLWPEPDTELEQRQFWRIVADCMATLPPRQAHAFSLCVLDGLETKEICRILDVAPANLWVTLHRARARMREQLEKHGFGGNRIVDQTWRSRLNSCGGSGSSRRKIAAT